MHASSPLLPESLRPRWAVALCLSLAFGPAGCGPPAPPHDPQPAIAPVVLAEDQVIAGTDPVAVRAVEAQAPPAAGAAKIRASGTAGGSPAPCRTSPDCERLRCEQQRQGQFCRALAERYLEGRGVAEDPRWASLFFQHGCNYGDAESCLAAGRMIERGQGSGRSDELAAGYFQQGCSLGSAASCLQHGVLLEAGRGIALDVPRAQQLYQAACMAAQAQGCTRLAALYEGRKLGDPDEPKAFGLYAEACRRSDPEGCVRLGIMTEEGRATAADPGAAARLYRSGCDGGEGRGCQRLAQLYEAGRGVTKDAGTARHLYRLACKAGLPDVCDQLVSRHERGIAPTGDAALYRRACGLGNALACTNYGFFLLHGRGVAVDVDGGLERLRQGCAADVLKGCSWLADAQRRGTGGKADPEAALRLYDLTCSRDPAAVSKSPAGAGQAAAAAVAAACLARGEMQLSGEGQGKPNPAAALRSLRRACQLDAAGCRYLAQQHELGGGPGPFATRQPALAAQYYDKACQLGDGQSCLEAAGLLEPVAAARALKLYERGCERGRARGCRAAGWAYHEGKGARRDEGKALSLLARACERGDAQACADRAKLCAGSAECTAEAPPPPAQ